MKAKLVACSDPEEFERKMNTVLSFVGGNLVDIQFDSPEMKEGHWYSVLIVYKE